LRYYNISIKNPATGANVLPSSLGGGAITSLLPNGQYNPAALNVQLDIAVLNANDPDSNSWVRIYGLGLKDISASLDLTDLDISISAGMSRGLPLANPAQAGLLVKGRIYQAFGNWIGTDQTLDLNIRAGSNVDDSNNFPFSWKAGTPLATAIGQTLAIGMPGKKQNIAISPNLVIGYDEVGYYQSLEQFAGWLNQRSQPIIGGKYQGVQTSTDGNSVTVYDGTVQPPANKIKQIAFQDMIGQPTWIAFGTISVTFVMRGDLNVGDTIHLPPAVYASSFPAGPRFQDQTTFTGNFWIRQMHHFGNFRQPDAASWTTVIQAFQVGN
jgi:hypothetical protein